MGNPSPNSLSRLQIHGKSDTTGNLKLGTDPYRLRNPIGVETTFILTHSRRRSPPTHMVLGGKVNNRNYVVKNHGNLDSPLNLFITIKYSTQTM
jgi:hypothetical protein